MADELELAASVRAALAGTGNIREVRMFGGIGFMLNGNLVAAASRRGLLLRVGKDHQAKALAQSGARPNGDARTDDGGLCLCRPSGAKQTGGAERAPAGGRPCANPTAEGGPET